MTKIILTVFSRHGVDVMSRFLGIAVGWMITLLLYVFLSKGLLSVYYTDK